VWVWATFGFGGECDMDPPDAELDPLLLLLYTEPGDGLRLITIGREVLILYLLLLAAVLAVEAEAAALAASLL
jgi:hypothetical protein